MELLKKRIVSEGRVLPNNIVKIDGFLNHLVDVAFLKSLAEEFRRIFPDPAITKILTAEASGIPLATVCAELFGVPLLFAKKAKSDNIEGGLYKSETWSYTYGKKVTFIAAREWLSPRDTVLIIDDFLARGSALSALCDIVRQSGARLAGIGIAVEKGFQGGGDKLRADGMPLVSLAIIDRLSDGKISFRE